MRPATELDLSALEALLGALNSDDDAEVLASLDLLDQAGRIRLVPCCCCTTPLRRWWSAPSTCFAGLTRGPPAEGRAPARSDAPAVRAAVVRTHPTRCWCCLRSVTPLRWSVAQRLRRLWRTAGPRRPPWRPMSGASWPTGSPKNASRWPVRWRSRPTLPSRFSSRGAGPGPVQCRASCRGGVHRSVSGPWAHPHGHPAAGHPGRAQGCTANPGDHRPRSLASTVRGALRSGGGRPGPHPASAGDGRDRWPRRRRVPRVLPAERWLGSGAVPGASGLNRLHGLWPSLPLPVGPLEQSARREVKNLYWLMDWRILLREGSEADPRRRTAGQELLSTLLRDKEASVRERLFRILDLLHAGEDFEDLWRGCSPTPSIAHPAWSFSRRPCRRTCGRPRGAS